MWNTVSLSDVCNVSIGKTPPRGDKRYWDKEKRTNNVWLSIADLSSSNDKYVSNSKEYLSNEGASLFKSVPKNTLIMSFKLSIGKLAFTKCELRTNEAIAALSIIDESLILKEFLYHYLSSLNWDILASHDQKVKGKTLNKKKLNALEIILPPLAEQERIVAKLDAAFAEIDEAINTAEAKETEVQKLKTSFLNSSLNNDAVTYSTAKLGKICILNYGKGLDKKDRSENAVIPVYGANGIKAYTDKLLHDKPSIIIGRKGSAGELNKVTKPFWALDVTYYVTTDETIVDIDFLFYALATLNLPSMARGIKPGINRNDVYNKSIKLPPLAEQQRIVAKLDAANSEFRNANEAIAKSKVNYLALKSAILAQELQSSEAV